MNTARRAPAAVTAATSVCSMRREPPLADPPAVGPRRSRSSQRLRRPAGTGGFVLPAVGQGGDVDGLLVRAGLDDGDLFHRDPLGGGQRPAERLLVRRDHGSGFGQRLLGSFGPQLDQLGRHAGDLGLAVLADRGPGQAEGAGQLVAQRGLVERAGGLLVRVDLMAVQGAPAPVAAADLVQHQGVGVQLRITGPRGAVVEHRGHEPVGAHLGVPVAADPGERRVGVQVVQRSAHRGGVRAADGAADLLVAERPQRADRLRRGERQVVTGDPVRPPRPAQRHVRGRVQRPAEQRLQLPLGDGGVRHQVERLETPPVPATGCLADAEEVLAGAVADLLGVVGPRPGPHLRRRQHTDNVSIA